MKLNMKAALLRLDGAVGKSTLYNAVKARRIPHYRIRSGAGKGRIVIEEDDLIAWLAEQRIEKQGGPSMAPLSHIKLSPAGLHPAGAKSDR